jgi:hypothetical protein
MQLLKKQVVVLDGILKYLLLKLLETQRDDLDKIFSSLFLIIIIDLFAMTALSVCNPRFHNTATSFCSHNRLGVLLLLLLLLLLLYLETTYRFTPAFAVLAPTF